MANGKWKMVKTLNCFGCQRRIIAVPFVLGWLLPMTASPALQTQNETRISICALQQRGKAADGLRVRLKAVFETDALEHSSLSDPKCPGVVMDLPYPAKRPWHKSVDDFQKRLSSALTDPKLGNYSIDISAEFRRKSVGVSEERRSGVLVVNHVWSVQEGATGRKH
jgi:hypothetical protein